MSDTEQLRAEFKEWFNREYPMVDCNRPKYQNSTVPELMQAAYQAGRAAAGKDAQHWRELCAAVDRSIASNEHVPLWGHELYAYPQYQCDGHSTIKVKFHYRTEPGKAGDLNAALDKIGGDK
jgi:hypothetical protein